MTTTMLRTFALPALLLSALIHQPSTSLAQGTAFTYHGRLQDNGEPVNGAYGLRFTLYDAIAAGNVIAGPIPVSPVNVTNGMFTARLDFGADVFTGPARWLRIEVRAAGAANFTPLVPRQEITASPYAIRAQTAGTATDVNLGAVVKSVNTLKDNVTLAAGANMTITPNGNILTLAAAGVGGSGIWSASANNAYYNAGNVGIGTITPTGRLEVNGNWDGEQGGLQLSGHRPTLRFTGDADAGNQSWLLHLGGNGPGNLGFFRRTGPAIWSPVMALTASGRQMEIYGQDALGLIGFQPFLTLFDSSFGYAASRIQGFQGDLVLAPASYVAGNYGTGLVLKNGTGFVGIGTLAPMAKFEVVGQDALRLVGYQPFLTLLDSSAGYARSRIQGVNGEIVLEPESYLNGSNPNSAVVIANSGNVSLSSLTIRGGADLAEPFELSTRETAKGSVVVIDSENPGKLKLSDHSYDRRVAGVVSGANGVNPGISLHQDGVFEGGQNVALSGRVYVLADAAQGAIKPGDLLTTSDTPGHAMRVSDPAKGQSAILGKAMSRLNEGKGLVLVLVTLQ